LENAKTDLDNLVKQIKNLDEKIAAINNKENKRFDTSNEVIYSYKYFRFILSCYNILIFFKRLLMNSQKEWI